MVSSQLPGEIESTQACVACVIDSTEACVACVVLISLPLRPHPAVLSILPQHIVLSVSLFQQPKESTGCLSVMCLVSTEMRLDAEGACLLNDGTP